MSSFHRGLNVSQYIANLNTIEPESIEFAPKASQKRQQDDLSLFANTQFFDFDMGRDTDAGVSSVDELAFDGEDRRRRKVAPQQPQPQHGKPEYNFLAHDYINFPVLPAANASNPGPQNLYTPLLSDHPTPVVYEMPMTPNVDIKRTSSAMEMFTPEESSKYAAEEDKRRRNTAASARFRIKKKQKEQQMERTTKELMDKVQSLESKIMQLEMENKWLKNLVVEKNEAKAVSEILNGRPEESAVKSD